MCEVPMSAEEIATSLEVHATGHYQARDIGDELKRAAALIREQAFRLTDAGHTDLTGRPRACCCATEHGASLRARAVAAEAARDATNERCAEQCRDFVRRATTAEAERDAWEATAHGVHDGIGGGLPEHRDVKARLEAAEAALANVKRANDEQYVIYRGVADERDELRIRLVQAETALAEERRKVGALVEAARELLAKHAANGDSLFVLLRAALREFSAMDGGDGRVG